MNGVEKAVNGVTALGTIIMHIVVQELFDMIEQFVCQNSHNYFS